MRRALAALLGAAVVAAVAGSASTAAPHSGVVDYAVLVQFRGTAKVEHTFEKIAMHEEYSFTEEYYADFESRNGIVRRDIGPLSLLSGLGYETWSNTQLSCQIPFEASSLTAQGMGDGVGTWVSHERTDLPDPGPENVLVTADPLWADTKGIGPRQPNCGYQFSLGGIDRYGHHQLRCVIVPGKDCHSEYDTGPVHEGCTTPGGNCDRGQANIVMDAKSYPASTDLMPWFELGRVVDFWPLYLPNLYSVPLRLPPFVTIPPYTIPTTIKLPPVDGDLDGQVTMAKQPLVHVHGRLKARAASRLALGWTPAVVKRAQAIRVPTPIVTRLTFTPATGAPVTITSTSYLLPRAHPSSGGGGGTTPPTITSVAFGGTVSSPTFVVHGKNLGTKPAPSPTGHPAGQGGCPTIAGDTGYDYGTSLYVLSSRGWSGGRYRPSANETDCIDLVVTKFTSTEVDFHFGPFYSTYASKFPLAKGDRMQVVVNGAQKTVTR